MCLARSFRPCIGGLEACPDPDAEDLDHGEAVARGLLVARRDPAELLEPVEEELDAVSLAVENRVEGARLVLRCDRSGITASEPCRSIRSKIPSAS
jgi:hypothetical protein